MGVGASSAMHRVEPGLFLFFFIFIFIPIALLSLL
jgi:hypothetical protein